jgi:hypothetical protein
MIRPLTLPRPRMWHVAILLVLALAFSDVDCGGSLYPTRRSIAHAADEAAA